LLTALIGFVLTPYHIKYLGVEAYGLIGFFAVLQIWASIFDFGLSHALAREVSKNAGSEGGISKIRQLLQASFQIYIGLGVLTIVITLLFGKTISENWIKASNLNQSDLNIAVILAGIMIAIKWTHSFLLAYQINVHRSVYVGWILLSTAIIKAVILVYLYTHKQATLIDYLVVQIAGLLCEIIILANNAKLMLTFKIFKLNIYKENFKPIYKFSLGMSGITLLGTLLTHSDKLIISKNLLISEYAQYTLAITVAGMLSMVISPINTLIQPVINGCVSNGRDLLINKYKFYSKIICFVSFSGLFFILLFGDLILMLWIKNANLTKDVFSLMKVYTLGTALNSIMALPFMLQVAHGDTKFSIYKNILTLIFTIPAMLYFIPMYGAIAACWIWVAINSAYAIIEAPYIHNKYIHRHAIKWYMLDIFPVIAASFLLMWALKTIVVYSKLFETYYLNMHAI
jgi:O-antigen/teichoic acid export membrane protein